MFQTRRDFVFLLLGGAFITNALLGELMGGKLFQWGPFVLSIGVIPWPVVFLTTDLINEYFGHDGVRRLTLLTASLISYAFIILLGGMYVHAAPFSPVTDAQFSAVFGQSLWVIVGSLVAFIVGQYVDTAIFWIFRNRTGRRKLWLRATGSTAISQLVDSFVVIGIGFVLPGKISASQYIAVAGTSYCYKLIVAVCLTPLIYGAHAAIDRFLGKSHDAAPSQYEYASTI